MLERPRSFGMSTIFIYNQLKTLIMTDVIHTNLVKDTADKFSTKGEKLLHKALLQLICNCVDRVGLTKPPTIKQVRAAQDALAKFESLIN